MNKMRSLYRVKVQQAGSGFNPGLSAGNWLTLLSPPEGSIIKGFSFLLLQEASSRDSSEPTIDPKLPRTVITGL